MLPLKRSSFASASSRIEITKFTRRSVLVDGTRQFRGECAIAFFGRMMRKYSSNWSSMMSKSGSGLRSSGSRLVQKSVEVLKAPRGRRQWIKHSVIKSAILIRAHAFSQGFDLDRRAMS